MSTEEIYQNIIEEAESLEQELIKLRREFHQYPEPGWMEMRTSARIAELLESYGCDQVLMGTEVCKADARMGVPEESLLEQHYKEVNALEQVSEEKLKKTRGGFTGVIGILHGKLSEERTASEKASERASENQVLAFRFDIDALPVTECEDKDHFPEKQGFRSICPGYMHACGHDCHTSMLLGAARLLWEERENLPGTVKLLFQAAEEAFYGSRYYVDKGYLDDVDAAMGMHVWPTGPSGKVLVKDGELMASCDNFIITVHGVSSHGSEPQHGKDAIVAASSILMNLQHIVSRINDPSNSLVVTVGKIQAGTQFNIITDKAVMEGTVRCYSKECRAMVEENMRRIVECTAAAEGCTAELEYFYIEPSLVNADPMLTDIARKAAVKLYGEDGIEEAKKATGSEDFSYIMDKIPSSVFLFLGCYDEEKGCVYPVHNEKFKIDEDILHRGSAEYAQFAADYLEKMAKGE